MALALFGASRPAEAAGPLDLCLGYGCSFDATVYYVDWTTINVAGGTASGAINLPSGPPVLVTLTAVNPDGSNGSFWGGQTGCGINYWNPTAPYISAEVPNPPPPCELVQLQGGQNQTYRMTFSQPVQDPLMAIVSLGSGGIFTTYDFDRPFTIVSQGAGYWGGDATRLVQLPGDILRGNEGHGTIRFLGTFPTFSWTVPTPEAWHGFTFGIRTTTALSGQQVTVNEGSLATNTGRWGGTDPVLTASVGTIVKNADGTWNWSFQTTDGPAEDQVVTITATEGGNSVSQTFNLAVKNVAPIATIGNSGPAPVGAPITATFTAPSDPSPVDLASLRYAFSCDGTSLAGLTYAAASPSPSIQCVYATPGPVTIVGRVIDKDGADFHLDYMTTTYVIADVTPPVVTPTVTGTLGNNGWYTSDIDVSWTVTDDESAVTSTSGCDSVTVTEDTDGVTFTCTATSAGGSASESVTVKRDATAPEATATRSPDANANGWNNSPVTVTFSGTDGLSGIDSCDAPVVLGEGAGQSASGTCTDLAGNVSAPASVSDINVDLTAPVVTVTGVVDGGTYTLGAAPAAGCDTTDALSGVATAATASVSGGTVGTFTVTCSGAEDLAGNTASATATYTVVYDFCGFQQPLLAPVQVFKQGSTVPVKFCVRDASGAFVSTAVASVYANGVFQGVASVNGNHYHWNLRTQGLGVGPLTIAVVLNDGTTHTIVVALR